MARSTKTPKGAKSTKKATAAKKKTAGRKAAARKAAPARKAAASGLAITGISPILTVNDVEQSLAFYRDVLGFTVKERWEQDGTLMGGEITAGRTSFMLMQDDWKKGRDRQKGEGFRIFADTTHDIDALAARIKAKGGTLTHEPVDEFGVRALALVDPTGFKITIGKQIGGRKG